MRDEGSIASSIEQPLLGARATGQRSSCWSLRSLLSCWSIPPPRPQRRLIDRNANFHQSNGQFFIRKRIKTIDRRALYTEDWFHSLVNLPTTRLILILLLIYMSLAFFFAIPYFIIAKLFSCNLGLNNFQEAFVFSLETMATIGFGTQDIFFDDCIAPVAVLAVQICSIVITNALVIGILYCRVARPTTRANTILFANHAVIRRIRGRLFLMFQICELRKHQLVEAHVRLYLIRHNRDPVVRGQVSFFQTCAMRLNHPNDELGGMLLLCLPQLVVHEIDLWSPLYPPPLWASEGELHRWVPPAHRNLIDQENGGKTTEGGLRDSSTDRGPRQGELCGTEAFPAVKARTNEGPSHSPFRSQRPPPPPEPLAGDAKREEKRMVQAFMQDRRIEVVAIVEGTDATTGGAVQSRHSYTFDEIVWDRTYARYDI